MVTDMGRLHGAFNQIIVAFWIYSKEKYIMISYGSLVYIEK